MKTIVAGSRSIKRYDVVEQAINLALNQGHKISELVSGGAKGVDTLAETWAIKNGVNIKQFLPAWDKYGLSAGPIRNRQMGDYADSLIAIWHGNSKGTQSMIEYAQEIKIITYLYKYENGELYAIANSR